MKIVKYKKLKNSKYKIELDNGKAIELYEDTILHFNLLIKKEIDSNYIEIEKYNLKYDAYYIALNYIKHKARSKKEIFDNLMAKEFNKDYIDYAVNRLENQGYINDFIYARSFLNNKIITTNHGPKKISNDLLKKGIDKDIISDVLLDYTNEIQLEKISKLINRAKKSNRSRSINMLKKKINIDLISEGFSKKIIDKVIGETEFDDDNLIQEKEYNKLYKRLSRKYSGIELEYKIKEKMYQKGFKI